MNYEKLRKNMVLIETGTPEYTSREDVFWIIQDIDSRKASIVEIVISHNNQQVKISKPFEAYEGSWDSFTNNKFVIANFGKQRHLIRTAFKGNIINENKNILSRR